MNRHYILIFILFMLSLVLACSVQANTILYVDDDAPLNGDGKSWATAYKYLQDALAEAKDANKPIEIRIAQGVYKPTTDRFELISGVTLKGGYAGLGLRGIPDPNDRDIKLYETILSGDLMGNDVEVDNPQDLGDEPTRADNVGILGSYQADDSAVLDGVTITGGRQTDPAADVGAGGGGMSIGGAGMSRGSSIESSPTIMNCTFKGNWGQSYGGAVWIYSGHPTFQNCTFYKNYAHRGGAIRGGGNEAKITNCSFTHNSAQGGGAIADYTGLISNCLFLQNTAYNRGSALIGCNGLTINCTFSGNSGQGGIVAASYFDSPTLVNCILWDGGNEIWKDSTSTISINYSTVWGGYNGIGNIDKDPLFANPINNDFHLKSQTGRWDTATQTWVVDYVTSPCIDTGDPNIPVELEPLPNGGRINMGVYGGTAEASKSYLGSPCITLLVGDINRDCMVDFLDLAILVSHWLDESPSDCPDVDDPRGR